MPRRPGKSLDVPDGAQLTQYGKGPVGSPGRFRDRPRADINEPDVSLLWGRVGVNEARRIVDKWGSPLAAVRYTTAGALRAHGYVVRHTPTGSNPKHISVFPPYEGGDPKEWDDALAKRALLTASLNRTEEVVLVSSYGPTPELGNLAWAPLPTVEAVEIIDRYNGVPTLGVVQAEGEPCLFWRVLSDDDHVSVWLYVPLSSEDQDHLAAEDDTDFLDTIVVGSQHPRYTTMGVAYDNRLVFEREWRLPAGLTADAAALACLEFCAEAMRVALTQNPPLPATRRQVVQKASDAVRHLAPC